MKLSMKKRVEGKKNAVRQLRRNGEIPAVLYAKGFPSESISINEAEFSTALRQVAPGRLPTVVFTLSEGKEEVRVLVKDIQRDPTTYQIEHLDFLVLGKGPRVTVKIPVEFKGVVECTGLKLGGFLRQVIRHVKVSCPQDQIPEKAGQGFRAPRAGRLCHRGYAGAMSG